MSPNSGAVEDGKFITSAGVSAGIDMTQYLTERLSDEATAWMVELDIDPKPPHGGIQWGNVNRDMFAASVAQQLKATPADKPDLLAKLTG